MTAWLEQTRLELLLIVRMRWPFLLPLAAGIYQWAQLAGMAQDGYADIRLGLIDMMRTFHTLSLALPMLLGVLLIRRDLLHPAYGWMHALPVSNAAYLLGKLCAGFLYLLLIPIATGIAYTLPYIRSGLPTADWAGSIMPILLQQSGSYAVTLVLGMAIGVLVPGRFALPIAFCGWLFGSVFLQEFIVVQLGWYPLKPFFLHHFLNPEYLLNEGWLRAFESEYTGFLPFVLLFMVFLLAWSDAAVGRSRPEGSPVRAISLALAALVFSALLYVPYAAAWTDRYSHIRALSATAPAEEAIEPHDPYVFDVRSATAEVHKISEHGIRVEAKLELPLRGNRPIAAGDPDQAPRAHKPDMVTFLLHPSLRVFEVKLNGAASAFERNGHQLSIPLPQLTDKLETSTATVEIRYEGELDEWSYNGAGEYYWAFVRDQGLYLPGHIGWFPIPGGDSLFFRSGPSLYARTDAGRDTGKTRYELELHGFGPLSVFATLPSGANRSGVIRFTGMDSTVPSLFGGSFIKIGMPAGGPAIITTPANRTNSERFLEELNKRIEYYAEWLHPNAAESGSKLKQIVYFPTNVVNSYGYMQASSLTANTVFLSSYSQSALGAPELQTVLRLMLFGDDDSSLYSDRAGSEHSIVGEIRNAILMLYELERETDPHWIFSPYVALTPDGIPVMDNIALMLREAVADGRSAEARGVLERFYREGLSIDGERGRGAYGEAELPDGANYATIAYEEWLQAWQNDAANGEKEAASSD